MPSPNPERPKRQRDVREAVKRHGRKMKDFNGKALRVLRDLERDPAEAAAVAVRTQDACASAESISVKWCRTITDALIDWAEDLGRPDTERDALLDGLRKQQEREDRCAAVHETLEELGALRYMRVDYHAGGITFIATNDRLSPIDERVTRGAAVVQQYVEGTMPDQEEMKRACRELTRCAKLEDLRARAREVELNAALKVLGLTRREDSTLCDAFVRGTAGKTAPEVAQVMAKFRYLYSGACAEFNQAMQCYVISPSGFADEFYSDSEYDSDEDDMPMVVTRWEFNQIRRETAAKWTDLPILWPWLTHQVVKVQRWWRAITANPYTKVGQKRLKREFDALTSGL